MAPSRNHSEMEKTTCCVGGRKSHPCWTCAGKQHRNVWVDCNLGNKWKLDSVVTCCSPRLIASHSFFVNIPGRSLTWTSPQPQKRCQIFRFSALQIEDEIDQTSENPWCAEEWLLWHAAVETVSWGCRVFTTQKCGLCSGMASTRWWISGSACQQYSSFLKNQSDSDPQNRNYKGSCSKSIKRKCTMYQTEILLCFVCFFLPAL